MKHSYTLSGMTCTNCMATVKKRLLAHSGVTSVELNLDPQSAVVEMDTHINTDDLQTALGGGKYKIYDDVAGNKNLV
ncbi:MAG TPA: heavy metal-associated domain-containing protein [Cyclobacteriaceae bacterium]|nr:heavy-metal-associated domain-containing protein [Cyclobacteriaceae bacterium]HMV08094.1 heavy metal-associated domain-containing protein [Cyclobacteriaceae bacterium]HMV88309.1 heavy metal-associated domain-containing protein [Cyclobacteriaceae bacterium]HMX00735.1 heavy metal-associated domain-containing protein [Cyclobacteriaceae bacterium]HMX49390.1 heavy metal-associated domain-containing protein [Cyclobacteriaceae bacterium]